MNLLIKMTNAAKIENILRRINNSENKNLYQKYEDIVFDLKLVDKILDETCMSLTNKINSMIELYSHGGDFVKYPAEANKISLKFTQNGYIITDIRKVYVDFKRDKPDIYISQKQLEKAIRSRALLSKVGKKNGQDNFFNDENIEYLNKKLNIDVLISYENKNKIESLFGKLGKKRPNKFQSYSDIAIEAGIAERVVDIIAPPNAEYRGGIIYFSGSRKECGTRRTPTHEIAMTYHHDGWHLRMIEEIKSCHNETKVFASYDHFLKGYEFRNKKNNVRVLQT